jgi:hypothetical protein
VGDDGTEVFGVLIQPTQDVPHKNVVSDVDAEVSEGVSKGLHLLTVVVDAKVTLNEAPEGGIDVEGAGFMVAEEVVLYGHLGIASRLTALPGDILQVGRDGVIDPQLDNVVHPVPRQNAYVHGRRGSNTQG